MAKKIDKPKDDIPGFPDLKIPPEPEKWGFRLVFPNTWVWNGWTIQYRFEYQPAASQTPEEFAMTCRQMCASARCAFFDEADRIALKLEDLEEEYDGGHMSRDFTDKEGTIIKALDIALVNANAWRKAGSPAAPQKKEH